MQGRANIRRASPTLNSGDRSMTNETNDTLNTAFKLSPVAACVVAALQPTGAALAQDNDEFAIDEIIVTATKRNMSLQDLAQSISALQVIARL